MIIDTAELERRELRRLAGARDKQVYIGPHIVTLGISDSCNLSCRYCWIHAPAVPNRALQAKGVLSWEKFLEVVGDCVDLKVDQIHIVGSGEPTLHPLFRDMMQHLQQQPLKVKLFTNATFSLKYCADVIKADHVLINLGAVTPEQYLKVHGQDLFDRVVDNIKRLVALREAAKPRFLIEIAYIVSSLNIDQKQEMQDLAQRLGVNGVCFKKMVLHPYNQDIALSQGPPPDMEAGEPRTPPPVCLNGWFYLETGVDGSCCLCCRTPHIRLGDFDKQSLKQLWQSARMMNIRLLGKYGYIQKVNKACQDCPFYEESIHWAGMLAGLSENE